MIPRRLAALAAIALLFAACSAGPGNGGELQGTQWVLQSYDDGANLSVVPDTVFADAEFANLRVTGTSGCNQYDAIYQSGGRTIFIAQPKITLMACDEATMTFEQRYLSLLQGSRYYGIRSNTLTIYDSARETSLVFDAAPRNPLLGLWDVDSFENAPGSVVAPLPDTTLNVRFGIKNVGGSSGCNTFDGTYETNGNVVRVSQLATTRLACPQDIMDQETAFLAALQGAALIDYKGSTVLLTDRSGSIKVALVRPVPEAEAPPNRSPSASTAPSATVSASPSASPSAS